MNTKFKKFLSEKGIKLSVLARQIGVSRKSFYNKLDGTSCFTQKEIADLSKFLALRPEQISDLFLN